MNYQQILSAFYEANPKWDVRCNDSLILTNAPSRINVQVLESTANRINHMLAISPTYSRAFAQFFSRFPQYKNSANEEVLVRALQGAPVSYENLLGIAETTDILNSLGLSAAALEVRSEEKERQRIIDEITLGKDKYSAYNGRHGRMEYFPSAHLKDETTERLMEIRDIVVGQREAVANSGVAKKTAAPQQEQPSDFILKNPATGLEYTKSELLKVINGPREGLRALFVAPDGRMKRGVEERVKAILKGQV